MKTHLAVLTILAISTTLLIMGASNSLVSAQVPSPCSASLSSPVVPGQYGSTNVQYIVPVLATCTTSYEGPLYAMGSAYDLTSNMELGSASSVLSSVNGGQEFAGELGFNLPPTSPSDSVRISVSVYSGQGGTLLTASSETIPADAGVQQPAQTVQQTVTTTVTVGGQYPYVDPTPTAYPSTYQPNQYPSQTQYQNHYPSQTHYPSQPFAQESDNANLLDYVAIVAIIAAVIITTVGLVLVARRQQPPQPVWYPTQPPPR